MVDLRAELQAARTVAPAQDRIGEWCAYHHELNKVSPGRRTAQLRVLRELEAQMAPRPIDAVIAADLEQYMLAMVRADYHPHTIVKNVNSMIRPFLKALWRQRVIDDVRWLHIREVEAPRGAYNGLPRPYNHKEIAQFWRELDERYPWTLDKRRDMRTPERGEYWVKRWAEGKTRYYRVYPYARRLQVEAIMALALYGGLRRNEVFTIGLQDMHYHNEYVRVASRKGPDGIEKLRVVPMTEAMAVALGNWIEFRAQVLDPPHEHPWLCLWYRNHGEPLRPMRATQFSQVIASIGQGWNYHRLRHTFGTERYRAGLAVEILQQTLGHATLKQTLAYTHISDDQVIEAARATEAKFERNLRRKDDDEAT